VDHRLEVEHRVRGVVEDHVEVVAVGRQHGPDGTGKLAVRVDAARAWRHRRFVAVHHGHFVTLASELEDQVTPDVPVAAHHQHAHGADPNQATLDLSQA